MARFLPSRVLVAKFAFFVVLGLITRLFTTNGGVIFWAVRLGASHYFDKWATRHYLKRGIPEPTGRWAWIKSHMIVPWSASYGADAVSLLANVSFFAYSRGYSKADACYTFLDHSGVLNLKDPYILYKSEICLTMHNVTRAAIAETSPMFKFLYRTSDRFSIDIAEQCMYVLSALSPISNGMTCPKDYAADMPNKLVASNERCTKFIGKWDPDDSAQWRETLGQALEQMGGMNQIMQSMRNDAEKPQLLQDGRSEESDDYFG